MTGCRASPTYAYCPRGFRPWLFTVGPLGLIYDTNVMVI